MRSTGRWRSEREDPVDDPGVAAARRAVMDAPAADDALRLVGLAPAIIDSRGGPPVRGLVNLAFADEGTWLPVSARRNTIDTVAAGIGAFEARRENRDAAATQPALLARPRAPSGARHSGLPHHPRIPCAS